MVAAASSGRLGGRVKRLRRRRGLTLEELAGLSGVSRAMISKLERGEKNPTLVVAAKLAAGLGVTLSHLAGMEERREVFVVPRERRMVMRDPETGFERQRPCHRGPERRHPDPRSRPPQHQKPHAGHDERRGRDQEGQKIYHDRISSTK